MPEKLMIHEKSWGEIMLPNCRVQAPKAEKKLEVTRRTLSSE